MIEWKAELEILFSIAETQCHAAYAAATHGLAGKWVYLARTTPNIAALLLPLEHVIQIKFLPALSGRAPPNTVQRDLLALPARLGGICLGDPSKRAHDEFAASVLVTSPLKNLISSLNGTYTSCCEVRHPQQEACATTGSCRPSEATAPHFPATNNDPGSGVGCLELVDCTPSHRAWFHSAQVRLPLPALWLAPISHLL